MSNSAVLHEELSAADRRALERRLREYHRRVEKEVSSGQRTARSLLVMLDAIPAHIEPVFPKKRYPTSAAAWRK